MIAAFAAALRRMTRRPLRSILTILEVALGALAVTLALNLVQDQVRYLFLGMDAGGFEGGDGGD